MKVKQEAAGGAYAAALEAKEAARAELLAAEKGLVGLEADAQHCRAELEANQARGRGGGAGVAQAGWPWRRGDVGAGPPPPTERPALVLPPLPPGWQQATNNKLAEEVEALRRELGATNVMADDVRRGRRRLGGGWGARQRGAKCRRGGGGLARDCRTLRCNPPSQGRVHAGGGPAGAAAQVSDAPPAARRTPAWGSSAAASETACPRAPCPFASTPPAGSSRAPTPAAFLQRASAESGVRQRPETAC